MYSFLNDDVVDITDFLYEITGNSAIIILFATTLASVIKKTKFRKTLGLFAFFYAFLHFMVFAFLDFEFNFSDIIKETVDKPFIYLGFISFILMIFLAITSFKKLFATFTKLHQVIYLIIILTFTHSIMSEKTISLESMPIVLVFSTLVFLKIRQRYIKY